MTTDIRKPITIVEIEQPRCIHRFGVGACTATGTPKCYNTGKTCLDIDNFSPTGSIKWRFTDTSPRILDFSDFSDADNPEANPIPCGVEVSTSETKINAGSRLDGSSPLGTLGTVSITLSDFPWNDRYGDFYLTDRSGYQSGRPPPVRAPFWALWTARNALFDGMFVRIYDGYEGQTLSEMRQRLYALEKVDGPDASGRVKISGYNPLRLADEDKAKYPPASDLRLIGNIDDSTTDIVLFGSESDLMSEVGTAGLGYFAALSDEIISFTGYTDEGDGKYSLTGVVRGVLGTSATSHSEEVAAQRVGRFEGEYPWVIVDHLLRNHTEMPDTFLPLADWNAEGISYMPTFRINRTSVKPAGVRDLIGEICQQSQFYIWWSEYQREIQMLCVRPPKEDPVKLSDAENLISGTVLTRDPNSRTTSVTVRYGELSPFGSKDSLNFPKAITAIDGDNLGDVRQVEIYAPWLSKRSQAFTLARRLLLRYKEIPEFLSIQVDAKDRETAVGAVADIETRTIPDTEGNANERRWQVISSREVVAGHSYALELQTYEYFGRFGSLMADGSPDYASATETERQSGMWLAGDDGLMSDGTEGYKFQ